MGTIIRIDGVALVRFTFPFIPSVNTAIDKARGHWSHGSGYTKQWRRQGQKIARQFMAECGPRERTYLIKRRAFLWVKIYRATEELYDVTNPWVKPIQDGFTDERIWPDDDWANLPCAFFSWQAHGPSDERVNKFVVEVHELQALIENGVAQVLPIPMGRRRKEADATRP